MRQEVYKGTWGNVAHGATLRAGLFGPNTEAFRFKYRGLILGHLYFRLMMLFRKCKYTLTEETGILLFT